ncbi:hypothetical protein C0Q70_01166 [Pomacea canaliculata]|uniref:Cyclic nucleotide-binding domain-containing protein n=1 Tax=Pomacea canaliculata TaxID=400727 RepID=A0A2T7PYS2_POMCA|nr:hypothetical protein C0Q70_01166 [Pomacea canaliculata]
MSVPSDDTVDEALHVDQTLLDFCSRSVGFLKNWPLQTLLYNPQACVFHYFNRGQVLVRDSNNSDWIYIVKSGSLSVLKKLRYTVPQDLGAGQQYKHGIPIHVSLCSKMSVIAVCSILEVRRQRASRRALREKRVPQVRSPAVETFRNQVEAEKRLEQSLPGLYNAKDRLGIIDYDRVIKEYRSRVVAKPSETLKLPKLPPTVRGVSAPERESLDGAAKDLLLSSDIDKETIASARVTEDSGSESGGTEERQEENRLIRKTSKGVYLAPYPARPRHDKSHLPTRTSLPAPGNAASVSMATDAEMNARHQLSVMAEVDRLNVDYQRRFRERVGRKTIAETLDYKGSRDFKYTDVDLNPTFILVQVLERGQYFGLSQVVYPDQPSVCLVSNGAECVVLSKRFFLDHASDTCVRQAKQSECPYPSEDMLQSQLQDYVNWEAHRARVYRRLVTDIRHRQARRKHCHLSVFTTDTTTEQQYLVIPRDHVEKL